MVGIPLYLIPRAIAEQIKKKREAIVYIEAKPEKGHFFTITVKITNRHIYPHQVPAVNGEGQ